MSVQLMATIEVDCTLDEFAVTSVQLTEFVRAAVGIPAPRAPALCRCWSAAQNDSVLHGLSELTTNQRLLSIINLKT
jgi:hypothetical protein